MHLLSRQLRFKFKLYLFSVKQYYNKILRNYGITKIFSNIFLQLTRGTASVRESITGMANQSQRSKERQERTEDKTITSESKSSQTKESQTDISRVSESCIKATKRQLITI